MKEEGKFRLDEIEEENEVRVATDCECNTIYLRP